jgi:hypothetical protein
MLLLQAHCMVEQLGHAAKTLASPAHYAPGHGDRLHTQPPASCDDTQQEHSDLPGCLAAHYAKLGAAPTYITAATQERAMRARTQVAAYRAQPQSIPEQEANFTEASVQQGYRRLANNLATGHDGLPAEMLISEHDGSHETTLICEYL